MRVFSENSGEGRARRFPCLALTLAYAWTASLDLSPNFVSGEVRCVLICRKAASKNCTTSAGGGGVVDEATNP
jgi:hypothetical protein